MFLKLNIYEQKKGIYLLNTSKFLLTNAPYIKNEHCDGTQINEYNHKIIILGDGEIKKIII